MLDAHADEFAIHASEVEPVLAAEQSHMIGLSALYHGMYLSILKPAAGDSAARASLGRPDTLEPNE